MHNCVTEALAYDLVFASSQNIEWDLNIAHFVECYRPSIQTFLATSSNSLHIASLFVNSSSNVCRLDVYILILLLTYVCIWICLLFIYYIFLPLTLTRIFFYEYWIISLPGWVIQVSILPKLRSGCMCNIESLPNSL